LLVQPQDATALANAVATLLQDTALAKEMSRNNVNDVSAYYIEKTAAAFEVALQKASSGEDR